MRRVMLVCAAIAAWSAASACASAPADDPPVSSTDDEAALSLLPIPELRQKLHDALEGISASRQEDYVTHDRVVTWLTAQVKAAGIADPTKASYVLQPKKFALDAGIPFDHSEVDIVEAIAPGKSARLRGRIIGDWWGAGVYDDTLGGNDLGPPLCVSWDELSAAIDASYVGGGYLFTFVCHDITFRVLDALGVSVADYARQIRGWTLASIAFGPFFAETPSAPATASDAARACGPLGVR